MRTRKDLLPWLVGRSGGGVRTSSIANQVQALANARAAAERGDGAAALQAVERLAGAASRVTREAYTDQRLYAYTSGDWSAQYGQRSRPLPMAIFDIYQRLKSGADPKGKSAALAGLEGEARADLTDALFIVAGKLNQASEALAETPVPEREKTTFPSKTVTSTATASAVMGVSAKMSFDRMTMSAKLAAPRASLFSIPRTQPTLRFSYTRRSPRSSTAVDPRHRVADRA